MVTGADLKVQGVTPFRHVDNRKTLLANSPDHVHFQAIFINMRKAVFVDNGLQQLEDELAAELLSRFKANASDTEKQRTDQVNQQAAIADFEKYYETKFGKFQDRPRGDDNIHKGLLTSVLRKTEDKFGFGTSSYAWGTSADAFINNLKSRRPFKDYGASKDHGDNTHRVQWYIICNSLFAGIADAARFYEGTANWVCDLDDPGRTGPLYLWELLCDNASNTTGWDKAEAVGLSPIYVMERMLKGPYPLLAAFCNYRRAKDFGSEAKSPHFFSEEGKKLATMGVVPKTLHRAAVRYLGKPLTSLSPYEKRSLIRYLGGMGFTLQ